MMASDGSVVLPPLPGSLTPVGGAQAPLEGENRQVNIFKLVHKHLRGRYLITAILCAAGAVGGVAAGYLIPVPKYRADGLIRIQPTTPRVLFRSEDSSIQSNFANFVSTQASLLQQPRVLSRAMNSDAWRALGRGKEPDAEQQFRKQLSISRAADAPELIYVRFSDTNPKASLIAVQEVIAAYEEIFGGGDAKTRELRLNLLTSRQTGFEKEKRDLEGKIQASSKEFETTNLERLSESYLTQLIAIEADLAEQKRILAQENIDPATFELKSEAGKQQGAAPDKRTPEQIAAVDRTMADYLEQRDALRRELVRRRAGGLSDQHRLVQPILKELQTVEQDIKVFADAWVEPAVASNSPAPAPGGAAALDLRTPLQKVMHYRLTSAQAESVRARAMSINQARIQIDAWKSEVNMIQEKLNQTNARLDELNLESKAQDQIGRIESILPDSPPSTPNDDPRMKFAAMGLMLGGGLPFAFMFLLGAIDRRFRYADQAGETSSGVPLLGILPELPSRTADPEQIEAAVHSVHHIRTRLQLGRSERKVYAVTSPTAGDGKTSLSLSLGMSFTAAGSRTLLVDFDLVGHALTRRLGASCEKGIGHELVFPGTNGLVAPTEVPGLSLIAAGRGDISYNSRVSRGAFAALIDSLRPQFDIIIIDTGPILGSLEANLASSVADGVVLVVGRGQHGARLQDAINHLTGLGARIAGMVFNRAHTSDFNSSSVASTSFRSIRAAESEMADAKPRNGKHPAEGFDSLARSMVRHVHDDQRTP